MRLPSNPAVLHLTMSQALNSNDLVQSPHVASGRGGKAVTPPFTDERPGAESQAGFSLSATALRLPQLVLNDTGGMTVPTPLQKGALGSEEFHNLPEVSQRGGLPKPTTPSTGKSKLRGK